jgi:anti-sigma regulatory factor (Ser/Thr protein kinase)
MMVPTIGQSTLAHQAFLYGSPDEFVTAMAPFVRAGLERGDVVFAATKAPNLAALREELGEDADDVQLEDTTEWMVRPYERLQAFKQMIAGLEPGQSVSAMGEPVWVGTSAVIRQWARYESIVNLALAEAPMRFICLYDSAALPDDILRYAVQTHPERIEPDGDTIPCRHFVPPGEFVAGTPTSRADDALEVALDLPALRRLLADYGSDLGEPEARVDELVLAASEVATNALRHAGADGSEVGVWSDDDEIVCQVRDSGHWKSDPLAGWVPPPAGSPNGWGLPIARQLCDAVEIVHAEGGGTTVSLHFARSAPSD